MSKQGNCAVDRQLSCVTWVLSLCRHNTACDKTLQNTGKPQGSNRVVTEPAAAILLPIRLTLINRCSQFTDVRNALTSHIIAGTLTDIFVIVT